MSKIHVLAVLVTESVSVPIKVKSQLKSTLQSNTPDLVRFVPVPIPSTPALESVRGRADRIPAGVPVTVHSPATGRQWTAEVTRTESNEFKIR